MGTLLTRARNMRKNATKPEQLLWAQLRNRQLDNKKFRRQVPIDHYIVDFLCANARLVIEIDGETHATQVNYDNERTKHLTTMNYNVIRFTNDEIMRNMDGVLETIKGSL